MAGMFGYSNQNICRFCQTCRFQCRWRAAVHHERGQSMSSVDLHVDGARNGSGGAMWPSDLLSLFGGHDRNVPCLGSRDCFPLWHHSRNSGCCCPCGHSCLFTPANLEWVLVLSVASQFSALMLLCGLTSFLLDNGDPHRCRHRCRSCRFCCFIGFHQIILRGLQSSMLSRVLWSFIVQTVFFVESTILHSSACSRLIL